ncbi:MAG TPA: DNA-protecting protein DprA [Lachnospiraceae bacterium]|nr:DNA-protecting protein DprA [Lachnospiraceae bacterium]
MEEKNYVAISHRDPVFPEKLRQAGPRPDLVYVKGDLPDPARPSVAIVGARLCSAYGRQQASRFGAVLASHGVQIISGLARGIDAWAHEGALGVAGSRVFGVLGCGIDVVYPRQNGPLYRRVEENGGLVSEYPPGYAPLPRNFPLRNRLISALADLVLVIEARERSGSLITVDCALEQGRAVYALPGRVDEPLSAGCNRLISQGAGVACSPEYLLEELKILCGKKMPVEETVNFGLATDLELVYSCLGFQPKRLQAIQEETGVSVRKLKELLLELELDGWIRELMKDYYVKLK